MRPVTSGMAEPSLIQEDFRELVAEAAAVAMERCGHCQTHHLMWPMNRIARIVSAVEGGRQDFAAAITRHSAGGRKRILIAGCSDTGILCLAANAVREHGAEFFVVDQCDTPLELCRRFAKRWDLQIETQAVDANDIAFSREFDIVLAHSMLQFIAPAQRLNVVSRFARALKPGGVAIQVFNAGARIEGALATEHERDYPDLVLARFDECGIVLPEPRDKVRARLEFQSLRRRQLEGAVATPEEYDALLQAAGFTVVERRETDIGIAESYGTFLSRVSRRRYISVARA